MTKLISAIDFFIRKPHYFFFIACFCTLFFGLTNLHSAYLVKDYIKTEAEIENVTPVRIMWHSHRVTRYNYDIVWNTDGKDYVEHMKEQVDPIEEGSRTVWVRGDNKAVALYNSVNIGSDVNNELAIAAVLGFLGVILFFIKKMNAHPTKDERLDEALNKEIGGGLCFVLSIILIGMVVFSAWSDYQKTQYFNWIDLDLAFAGVFAAIISAIFFFVGRHQSK